VNAEEICRKLDEAQRSGAGLEEVLSLAVELLHQSNPRFHWTGIYELCPDNVLRLGPFLGAPTDHVFIAVGRGVCGTAVAENRNINVPDVTQAPNYLACSSETRSELVVLIRKNKKIFAQIDIDSHELNAFDRDAVTQVETVAEYLANAYASSAAEGAPEAPGPEPKR
jgi:GAF domain-containing protein